MFFRVIYSTTLFGSQSASGGFDSETEYALSLVRKEPAVALMQDNEADKDQLHRCEAHGSLNI